MGCNNPHAMCIQYNQPRCREGCRPSMFHPRCSFWYGFSSSILPPDHAACWCFLQQIPTSAPRSALVECDDTKQIRSVPPRQVQAFMWKQGYTEVPIRCPRVCNRAFPDKVKMPPPQTRKPGCHIRSFCDPRYIFSTALKTDKIAVLVFPDFVTFPDPW